MFSDWLVFLKKVSFFNNSEKQFVLIAFMSNIYQNRIYGKNYLIKVDINR